MQWCLSLHYFSLKWKFYTIWGFFPQQIFRSLRYWHPSFPQSPNSFPRANTFWLSKWCILWQFVMGSSWSNHMYWIRMDSHLGPGSAITWIYLGTCLCKALDNLTLTSPATCRPTLLCDKSAHLSHSAWTLQRVPPEFLTTTDGGSLRYQNTLKKSLHMEYLTMDISVEVLLD